MVGVLGIIMAGGQGPSGPPIIGTATATGLTTATVTYTAPSIDGGSTITSYTATSNPDSVTGTLSQAGSGIITVNGLNSGTSYTFTVYATNSVGNSANSAASNQITTATLVEYLVVAGGGGGGTPRNGNNGAGGGGGGGLLAGTLSVSGSMPHTITVGDGGVPVIYQIPNGSVGSNSVFASITTLGGGSGSGSYGTSSLNGGSGGGGGTGTAGPPRQGYDGGGGGGTGGGGAGAVGGAANGGVGLASSITGVSTYYAGGGASFQTGAIGGLGGGGNTSASYNIAGGSGSPNTGGGGAAGTLTGASISGTLGTGGSGGSGVVVIAYSNNLPLNYISTGLTYTSSTTARSGYRLYTFTTGTGSVSWATGNTVPGVPQNIAAYPADTGTASVTFTAAYDGGSAINSYTATSSPSGFTGTASASPITVTGLTDGVAYTFTVYATNSVGDGQSSLASNSMKNGDLYYSSVGLLLKTNSTNGLTNNNFVDSSSNGLTITRVGSTTGTYFNPYGLKFGSAAGSGYFNGASYITAGVNAAFSFGTGNFTVEAWVYTTVTALQAIFDNRTTDASTAGFFFGLSASNVLSVYLSGAFRISTGTISTNTWTHVVLVRNGSTWTTYINGTSAGTYTSAASLTNGNSQIGASTTVTSSSANYFTGYISNLRVVNGTAVYTGNFTSPTAPLSATQSASTNIVAITSTTALLLNFNGQTSVGIYDASPYSSTVNPLTVVTFGSAQSSTDTAKWASTSMRFNGTTDYLSVLNTTTAFAFGAGDFTIEMWARPSATTTGTLIDFRPANTYVTLPAIIIAATTNVLQLVLGANIYITGTTAITLNAWNHVALARSSGVTKLYLNGVQQGASYTDVYTYDATTADRPIIGAQGYTLGSVKFNGYIQDLRVTIGVARYTGTPFAPPTISFIAATTPGNVPGAPTIGTASLGSGNVVSVTFTQPASNGGVAIARYTAVANPGGVTGRLNQSGSGTVTVAGLPPNSSYTFTVYASNSIGNSSISSTSNIVTTYALPGTPTIGTATQTGSITATVAFTAPVSNGGTAITSYTAVSSPGGITGTLTQAGSGTITVSGLTQGASYTFTVYATNIMGNSPSSNASNQITTPYSSPPSIEYLIVAGGGGAGYSRSGDHNGGGGGAGGMLTSASLSVSYGTYSITVGGGGPVYTIGNSSVFSSVSTVGGGNGGGDQTYAGSGSAGGSGGGGTGSAITTGGAGTVGQGNDGSNSGGGGGAGAAGATNGGVGLQSSITGVSTYYAGGGGGAGGTGGLGGGGNASQDSATPGSTGSPNTGGGGGSSGLTGASATAVIAGGGGGSGVVIIAYPNTYPAITTITAGLTYDQPATRSGYRVYRFTAGSGTITWQKI